MDCAGIINGISNAMFSIENSDIGGRQLNVSPAVKSIVKCV